MSKHTPGPWYVLNGGTDDTAISTKPAGNHYDDDNEVLGYSEWLRVKDDDLTLMAAAPELLDALKELYYAADSGQFYDDHDEAVDRLRRARVIIAKATGEMK